MKTRRVIQECVYEILDMFTKMRGHDLVFKQDDSDTLLASNGKEEMLRRVAEEIDANIVGNPATAVIVIREIAEAMKELHYKADDDDHFSYEMKGPDRVYWQFSGSFDPEQREEPFRFDGSMVWQVSVSQESHPAFAEFEMFTYLGVKPTVDEVVWSWAQKALQLVKTRINYHVNRSSNED